jgi:hypothetical protein
MEVGGHYSDAHSGLEVRCTHSGAGLIAADGRALTIKHLTPL